MHLLVHLHCKHANSQHRFSFKNLSFSIFLKHISNVSSLVSTSHLSFSVVSTKVLVNPIIILDIVTVKNKGGDTDASQCNNIRILLFYFLKHKNHLSLNLEIRKAIKINKPATAKPISTMPMLTLVKKLSKRFNVVTY